MLEDLQCLAVKQVKVHHELGKATFFFFYYHYVFFKRFFDKHGIDNYLLNGSKAKTDEHVEISVRGKKNDEF